MSLLSLRHLAVLSLTLPLFAGNIASANTVDTSVMTQLSNIYGGDNIAAGSASLVYGIGMNWSPGAGEFIYAQQATFGSASVSEVDGNTFSGFDLSTHSYINGNAQTTATAQSSLGTSKGKAVATTLPSLPLSLIHI